MWRLSTGDEEYQCDKCNFSAVINKWMLKQFDVVIPNVLTVVNKMKVSQLAGVPLMGGKGGERRASGISPPPSKKNSPPPSKHGSPPWMWSLKWVFKSILSAVHHETSSRINFPKNCSDLSLLVLCTMKSGLTFRKCSELIPNFTLCGVFNLILQYFELVGK